MGKWKLLLMIIFFICTVLPGLAQENKFPVPTGNSKQLFYLQRTQNANTIVYELNYKDGVVDKENPVHGFWIRYQEKGQREELSFLQKKFAFGHKTKKIANNHYELTLVAYKKYKMYLRLGADKKFYVYGIINRKPAILTRIFIHINGGSFWSPNIEYVEISGIDAGNNEQIMERIKIS